MGPFLQVVSFSLTLHALRFQHLNGLVGLTSDEIELLNGSRSSRSYCSSLTESVSTSYPPSLATEMLDYNFSPSQRTLPPSSDRPSSLPSRRLNAVAVRTRSKTPQVLPNDARYKQSSRAKKEIFADIPADLQPSELLQPPPDTSSDDESDIFIAGNSSRRRSSSILPDPVEFAIPGTL